MSFSIKTAARRAIETAFRLTRPAPSRPLAPMGTQARPYPSVDAFSMHTGRRLTVKRILAIYALAECGSPLEQCDLFEDRIEVDAHLRSALEARLEGVARKPWIIIPGGDEPDSVTGAQILSEAMGAVPNFGETREHQGRANWYGYAASEIDWKRIDGTVIPAWFANVPPQRFEFDDRDNPLIRIQGQTRAQPLIPDKWWFTARGGRRAATSGLMRTAAIYSHFKSLVQTDGLMFVNRFGIPYVIATHPGSAIEDELKTQIERALRKMGTDGHAIFPEEITTVVHDVMNGRGGTDLVHKEMCSYFDQQNSKLILGSSLLSETQGAGSFALGKVHADRGFDILLGDAETMAQSFERCVAAPFMHFNGLNGRPPRLKIHMVREMDPLTQGKLFAMARNELGLELDADQVRNQLQLQKPTGEVISPPQGTANESGSNGSGDATGSD